MSPPLAGSSILMTSAPRSARCTLPNGPAPYCSSAMMRMSSSGFMPLPTVTSLPRRPFGLREYSYRRLDVLQHAAPAHHGDLGAPSLTARTTVDRPSAHTTYCVESTVYKNRNYREM